MTFRQYESFLRVYNSMKLKDGTNPLVCNLFESNWEKQTRLEYESQISQKKLEIQNLTKQHLKDPVRISMSELADIQLKFGYDSDSILIMRKTFDECQAREDQYTMARKIMFTAFETGNFNFQSDFSDRALDRDHRRSSVETGLLQILNAHAYGKIDLKLMARKFASMQIISIDN